MAIDWRKAYEHQHMGFAATLAAANRRINEYRRQTPTEWRRYFRSAIRYDAPGHAYIYAWILR